jgi:hypothetical protein
MQESEFTGCVKKVQEKAAVSEKNATVHVIPNPVAFFANGGEGSAFELTSGVKTPDFAELFWHG